MKRVALGEITTRARSVDPAKSGLDQFMYVDLSSIDQSTKVINDVKMISSTEAPSRARQVVAERDVLVATVRPNLNGVAKIPSNLDGAVASTGFTVLRAIPSALDDNYLFHWVKSPDFIADMMSKSTGASYPAVSDRIVKESRLPLPPLDAQRRIAAILDKADELRAKRHQTIAHLDTLTQSLFHSMFGAYLEKPSNTVGGSGTVQLGRQRAPKYQTGNYSRPYIRVANVKLNKLDLDDVLEMDFDTRDFDAYRLKFGDILLNEGQSTELVGRPAMWRGEIEDCCFQNTLVRYVANPNLVIPEFALATFMHYFERGEFSRISSKTSSIAHLGATRFARMLMPTPPLDLQRTFAGRIAAVERLKETHRKHLAELDTLFASLQHRAFKGEL